MESSRFAYIYLRTKTSTHVSNMLGSVNCTNRSLSCSTPGADSKCQHLHFFCTNEEEASRLTESHRVRSESWGGHDDLI